MASSPEFQRAELIPTQPQASICYLLGAGFSAASRFRLPVSQGFLTRTFEFHQLDNGGVHEVPKLVRVEADYQAGRRDFAGLLDRLEEQYGPLESLNLEAVMADLHIRAHGLGLAWEPSEPVTGHPLSVSELQRDYRALLSYIAVRLRVPCREPGECALTRRLVMSLRRQDSVLTLNYDTLIERHLDAHKLRERVDRMDHWIGPAGSADGGDAPARFRDHERLQTGVFAKLHGSIDWLTCGNDRCPEHDYIQSARRLQRECVRLNAELRCSTCGRSAETVIIPPTATKVFDRFPKLNVMWLQSYLALRRAQRWVCIGVSFASTDFHLSSLLRAAARDARYFQKQPHDPAQICIVSRSYESAENSGRRLFQSLPPHVRQLIDNGTIRLSAFESVQQYLETVENSDGNRHDRPVPNDV